jgi:glycosyltransferase involved in cell wall biosynthesis
MTSKRIAVFASFSGNGGVERMLVNLCSGFADRGHQVDLLLIKDKSDHLQHLPKEVNIIRLGTKHAYSSLFPLMRYLKQQQPDALLSAKERANRVALLARKLSGVNIPIATRLGTTVSAALEGKSWLRKWMWFWPMKLTYQSADTVIPVSQGVANDVINITGISAEKVKVIRNPVITPRMHMLSQQPIEHAELFDSQMPTIIGAGRFTRQKDFLTLIKALAIVNKTEPCRLVLLGEGKLRDEYQALATSLNIGERLFMPGFTHNPYPSLIAADCFVLSSAWEGSPNVLTEALAMGTPVVATDCPSGPVEILENGKYGPLVEIGDEQAMAKAILAVLTQPHSREFLQQAAAEYTIERSVTGYLKAMGLEG